MRIFLCGRSSAFLLLICSLLSPSFGQQRSPSLLTLRNLTRHAGYIFAGRVTSVEYLAPKTANEVATMRVTFQVEEAIRGTRAGAQFVLREWAGLWDAGERYRVGERVLLFLHRPGKLGLTSPVGGLQGRFALDRDGYVVLGRARTEMFKDRDHHPELRDRIGLREFRRAIRQAEAED